MAINERKEGWMRIVVLIVAGIVLYFWGIAVAIVAIVNWLVVIFTSKRDRSMAEFCEMWNSESYRYYRYMTFVSNERPFPFVHLGTQISKFK